ncbi:MAG: glycosyltransferase family 1 protein, partial [Anaerolineae bacterium]|nr:glycosyltransferase family 1 protein [Anaerolineae bacterium]
PCYVASLMRMHVCVDVSPTAQGHAGLGRYAGEVARGLADHQPDIDLTLFYNRHRDARLPDYLQDIPYKTVNIGNKPWRMGVLLSQMSGWPMDDTFGAVDIFHATNHLLASFSKAKTVFTLHDLIFLHYPEYHLPYNRWYLTFAMPRFLRAADIIITPSECSRQDAIKFYGIPEDKIKVIYEAASSIFQPGQDEANWARVQKKYNLPQKFMLHVATIEPRKNLSRLLDAFKTIRLEHPDLKLVLIGKKGWLYDDFFKKLQSLGLETEVIFPGFVEEIDLPACYQLAELFVYPSLYEGFGLPPLEAMACGVPVVCSNRSSLPEVVGKAGVLFDPTDTQALTEALRQVLANADLRKDLAGRSIEQASRFSWQKAAAELDETYRHLYA